MKLRDYFLTEFAPVFLGDAAPRTFEAYEHSITAWEKTTGDPDLAAIDVRVLAAFKHARGAAVSPATVNKDLRHIGHLLAKAGPPGHRNRDALGLLPSAPWTRPLRVEADLPKAVPLASISRVYQACHVAQVPRICAVSPEAWFQGLIVFLYNTSCRIGAALHVRWADVDLAAGTLRIRPAGDKRRRGREKPVNDMLRRHLLRIRSDHERVFPLTCCLRWLYRQWDEINTAAGLAGETRVRFHDLKRASVTEASAIADPFAVQLFADHQSLDTTTRHYANASGRLAGISEKLPQPEAFSSAHDAQRRLFA